MHAFVWDVTKEWNLKDLKLNITLIENFAPWIPALFQVAANFSSSIEHFMALVQRDNTNCKHGVSTLEL